MIGEAVPDRKAGNRNRVPRVARAALFVPGPKAAEEMVAAGMVQDGVGNAAEDEVPHRIMSAVAKSLMS
jgi:hypothetical protein